MANTIAIKPKKRLWLSLTPYCKKTSMLHIKYISNKLQDKEYSLKNSPSHTMPQDAVATECIINAMKLMRYTLILEFTSTYCCKC
jgi:hypothetical protein